MAKTSPGPTILTVAVTGNLTTVEQNSALPKTPKEIAQASIDAAKAGAAISHIHVRYPDGRPSMELAHYREVVDRIRDSGSEILINLTTGPGQRFIPSRDDPKVAAPGTTLTTPERRVEHVVELRPDICSLDLNTMWSGSSVVINTPWSVAAMARLVIEAGVKPELEVFDSGDIHLARKLLDEGELPQPPLFQIVTGVSYGFAATTDSIVYARNLLPAGAQWACFGIGRMAFPMLAQAWILGGHVRIGMEDTVTLSKGVPAPSNAALVEKAARIIADLGGTLATPKEARRILGLAS
ncbi:MAG: 3-keto-5-aminohexanoate cleavage protein [Burkholderiaceae bacterium]|nr:3-keto-5-aminohexanoate cleavage protein [Burkholderiaceae bacterium]